MSLKLFFSLFCLVLHIVVPPAVKGASTFVSNTLYFMALISTSLVCAHVLLNASHVIDLIINSSR